MDYTVYQDLRFFNSVDRIDKYRMDKYLLKLYDSIYESSESNEGNVNALKKR